MGRARTIARRSVLIGSAVVVGGVAFGAYRVRKAHENPLLSELAEGEATFNPYVKVTIDEIILITPHADAGQGVSSLQAALIAEELDVELDQVTLSFGKPGAAYYNTALAAEAVPFASFDDSLSATTMRSIAGAAIKVLGVMATGGSTTVPDQYEKLRLAGAVARETLKRAASEQSGVAVAQLQTAGGAVLLPDGTRLSYMSLARAAAGLEPVTDVALRPPSAWRLIGKPVRRTDVIAKSTGTMAYGIDKTVAGMVHAAIRVNPRRGPVISYDSTRAQTMRGVSRIVAVAGGAAVIADNTWRAIQAVNAIDFNWGAAPYPAQMEDHWQAVAGSFTPERLDKEWRADGDVDAALSGADRLEAEYRAPYVAHQPLEPLSAIVRVDEDGAEVWAGHQMPRFVQLKVAAIAGCDAADVIFHNQFIGGSFGHRLEFDNITRATEIAVQMKGTPVKLTYAREEDFAHDYPRQIGMSRSVGAVREGRVEAWALDIATVSSSRSQTDRLAQTMPGPDPQIVAGAWNMAYDINNLRVRGYAVPALAPTSSWRSVGASSAGFFAEAFLDELIHAAGADPLGERLRLCNNEVHRKVLEAAGEMSDWGSDMGAGRGRGIAMVESFGVPVAEVVEVTMTDNGLRIDKVFVAADVGRVLDPVNFENLMQGGVIWGLGHAMNCEITYADGIAAQSNFDTHSAMRLYQTPEIHVRGLENAPAIRGIGEPPVPPAAPALANAIFAATGERLREMPFNKFIDFV